MKIFDTHCDTPFDMYRKRLSFDNDITNVSLSNVKNYQSKIFVSAFWSDSKKDPESCWEEFLKSSKYFDGEAHLFFDSVKICKSPTDISACDKDGRLGMIKAIEGAKLLCGSLDRLHILYNCGIRHIIPVWGGSDFIGGAWDTQEGLTDFGIEMVRECEKIGIVLDASHISAKGFWDMANAVECPIVASHSNFKEVSNHARNLDNWQLKEIIRRKGIVGINLCAAHVCSDKYETRDVTENDDFIGDVVRNIYYFLEMGGRRNICLGCDFDGTKMPPQIPDASKAVKIYERLISDGVGTDIADDIFFNNAYNFYIKNLR